MGQTITDTVPGDRRILGFNSLAVLTPPTLVLCRQLSPSQATFTCKTTTGALLWIQGTQQHHFTSTSMVGDNGSLGYFTTRLDSIEGINYTSTATIDVFSLPSNISNITIMCDHAIGAEGAVLIINGIQHNPALFIDNITDSFMVWDFLTITNYCFALGPPLAPTVTSIILTQSSTLNRPSLLISWSMSDCAVQCSMWSLSSTPLMAVSTPTSPLVTPTLQ